MTTPVDLMRKYADIIQEAQEPKQQLGELGDTPKGQKMLKKYIKKAGDSAEDYSWEDGVVDPESGHSYRPNYVKRIKGIERAEDRLKSNKKK